MALLFPLPVLCVSKPCHNLPLRFLSLLRYNRPVREDGESELQDHWKAHPDVVGGEGFHPAEACQTEWDLPFHPLHVRVGENQAPRCQEPGAGCYCSLHLREGLTSEEVPERELKKLGKEFGMPLLERAAELSPGGSLFSYPEFILAEEKKERGRELHPPRQKRGQKGSLDSLPLRGGALCQVPGIAVSFWDLEGDFRESSPSLGLGTPLHEPQALGGGEDPYPPPRARPLPPPLR